MAEDGENSSDTSLLTDYKREFDDAAYLEHFYGAAAAADGQKLLLFALPNFIARMPTSVGKLLDVGSGPTIYVALCFRKHAQSIVLTDFAECNCENLRRWWCQEQQQNGFDWTPICKSIARCEGVPEGWRSMEDEARKKVTAGCDVHEKNLFVRISDKEGVEGEQFDTIVSVFCLESACQNYAQYAEAMCNVTAWLRHGGRLILGSVLEDDLYQFGV